PSVQVVHISVLTPASCTLHPVLRCCVLPDVHSFPTRRSSALADASLARRTISADTGSGMSDAVGIAITYIAMRSPSRTPLMTASDRKSTRLNSSHVKTSYAVFCWKKKTEHTGMLSHTSTVAEP